jgi:hypothetical protein
MRAPVAKQTTKTTKTRRRAGGGGARAGKRAVRRRRSFFILLLFFFDPQAAAHARTDAVTQQTSKHPCAPPRIATQRVPKPPTRWRNFFKNEPLSSSSDCVRARRQDTKGPDMTVDMDIERPPQALPAG